MQKTIAVRIVNSGARGQVFPTPGGLFEIRSGQTVERVDILPLSEERIGHYAARGVTIEEAKGRKKPARQADMLDIATLEADVAARTDTVAAMAKAAKADGSDANKAALATAEADLAVAEKALAAAQTA
ncbi:MAG: hypothetical protein BGN87_00160 [Rhizobiales bacterium 65-79]|nr:hypothetical protein [Hyphomicrobiales bacterium]OJU02599.1 MAG: hypothetical protein BGN87_00160 [Rhizobiales bacterium 65-79]